MPDDEVDQFRFGVKVCGMATRKFQQVQEVAEAAGVVEHLTQRDCVSVIRYFREIFPDIVIQREKSLLRCQYHAGGGELFRNGTHIENGLRGEWNSEFNASHAEGFTIDKVSSLNYAYCTTWRIWSVVGSEYRIYSLLLVVWGGNWRIEKDHGREDGDCRKLHQRSLRTESR